MDAVGGRAPGFGVGASAAAAAAGLLVFDAAGHVYELAKTGRNLVTAANQATPAEAQALFGSFGGFWGSYKVDAARKQLTIRRRSGDDSTVASGFSRTRRER
jgi:hypothetical protein